MGAIIGETLPFAAGIAASPVPVLVIVVLLLYAVAADTLQRPLEALSKWLLRENYAIMAVLFFVLGANAIGDGIARQASASR